MDSIDSFRLLFCRICGIFNCQLHRHVADAITAPDANIHLKDACKINNGTGSANFDTSTYLPRNPIRWFFFARPDKDCGPDCCFHIMNKKNVNNINDVATYNCGESESQKSKQNNRKKHKHKFEIGKTPDLENGKNYYCLSKGVKCTTNFDKWTQMEHFMMSCSFSVFGEDFCSISKARGRKCKEVFYAVVILSSLAANTTTCKVFLYAQKYGISKELYKGPGWTSKGLGTLSTIRKDLATGKFKPITMSPCKCAPGECRTSTCDCAKYHMYCTKYCKCGPKCDLHFHGCDCKDGCLADTCPCKKSARECDPSLCLNCNFKDGYCACHNRNLQLDNHKHVLIGPSEVHGWGGFSKGPIKRGQFILEYRGEVSFDFIFPFFF